MTGRSVGSALLLLVIGNALAIGSDVVIKLMHSDTPLFQFMFARALITVTLLLPLWKQVDQKRLLRGGKLHLLRAHISVVGVGCMIIALQSLPLATANALFYSAPLLVVLFAMIFFGERLKPLSGLAVVSGFVGILVILRPVEIGWGALGALGAATALAANAVMVRKLPEGQSSIHVLLLNTCFGLPAIALLTLMEAAAWDWGLWRYAFGSSALLLGYNLTVLMAYRHVAANQVTSAEYTGLLWAVAIGWLWFDELPDLWFVSGALLIVIPLLLLAWQHRRRLQRTLQSIHSDSDHPL